MHRRPGTWCKLLTSVVFALSAACDLSIPSLDPVDAGGPDTPPPSLDDILRDNDCERFTADDFACGGDPVGDWEVVVSCPATGSWDPLNGTCPEIEAGGDGQASGTLHIGTDGAYALTLDRLDVNLSFSFPLSCYGGASEPCNGANFSGVCVLPDDTCSCAIDLSLEPVHERGAWYSYRENMTFRGDDYAYDLQFCRVDEHVMRLVRFASEPGELSWGFVLRRTFLQPGSELGADPG